MHEDITYFTKGFGFSNALSNTEFSLAELRTILLKDLFPACRHSDDACPCYQKWDSGQPPKAL